MQITVNEKELEIIVALLALFCFEDAVFDDNDSHLKTAKDMLKSLHGGGLRIPDCVKCNLFSEENVDLKYLFDQRASGFKK